jgi:hypothetical protein
MRRAVDMGVLGVEIQYRFVWSELVFAWRSEGQQRRFSACLHVEAHPPSLILSIMVSRPSQPMFPRS